MDGSDAEVIVNEGILVVGKKIALLQKWILVENQKVMCEQTFWFSPY